MVRPKTRQWPETVLQAIELPYYELSPDVVFVVGLDPKQVFCEVRLYWN